ncbi:hypothetical protein JZU46_02205 [bacterium]|nr:hypothetical protein [bacterium]
MFVKVINFSRKYAQTRRDLNRLLKYLLQPKIYPEEIDTKPRLLGPPLGLHLAMTLQPWGTTAEAAADDLSRQMVLYAKEASDGKPFPHTWYLHVVLSFHPRDAHHIDEPKDELQHKNPYKSRTNNVLRISIDILKTMGVSLTQPIFLVPHADRRHLHVHAVIVLPLKNFIEDWKDFATQPWHFGLNSKKALDKKSSLKSDNYLLQFSREDLYEISIISTKAFELTPPSKRSLNRNKDIKRLWTDLDALSTRRYKTGAQ